MQHSPIQIPPPEALAAIPTPAIAAAIDQLIDALDCRDGDPDLEDSEAGEWMIDGRGRYLLETKIGFDAGGEPYNLDTEDSEAAYPEWHTLGRHKGMAFGMLPPEDAEDDDQDACLAADDDPKRRISDGLPGDRYDTEPNGDEGDYSCGDGGHCGHYGVDQSKGPTSERQAAESLAAEPPARTGADEDLGPEDVPEVYASIARGRCLEPVYRDGDCIVFSKSQPVNRGDFVGLWLKPGVAPTGQPDRLVKRLAMDLMPGLSFPYSGNGGGVVPLVVVEMLNPPKRMTFRASDVLAIHKVVGTAETMGNGMAAVSKDSEAARLAAGEGEARP